MAQILVVDDEVGIRELLSEILADEGHQVLLAESAGDARRLRERDRPDLVLLDIWMPDTDGITLLKEWAASGQLTMPVVMMSGHGTIETAVEATRIGALDYLEKPIALQRLLATVKRALRNQETAAAPRELSLAALGRSPALAEVRTSAWRSSRRPARRSCCAASAACAPELFARLLAAPGAPFVAGGELLAEAALGAARARRRRHPVRRRSFPARPRRAAAISSSCCARAEKHRRAWCRSRRSTRAACRRSTISMPSSLARLAELTLKLPAVRDFAEDVPDLAALMLAQLVEARACPPRRFVDRGAECAAPSRLARQSRRAGERGEEPRAERARGGDQLEDVERVLAAHAGPRTPPEVALDRPYREAREAFERAVLRAPARARERQHVAGRRALGPRAHAPLPQAQGARPAGRQARGELAESQLRFGFFFCRCGRFLP